MRIVICSNIANGIGLQREFELLRDYLTALGHEVTGQQWDQPAVTAGDLCIWIEVFSEHLVPIAPRHWLFANPEWMKPEYIRGIQRHCEIVFAKTRDAERVLRGVFNNVHYVGFLTTDKRDGTVARDHRFLHIGGNSGFRNTNAVIDAWRGYRYWNGTEAADAPITIVSNSKSTAFEGAEGVTFVKRGTDEEIKRLQNSCLFHILPSAYEGFGHALHEALSVGAILLSTGAGPMAEVQAPFQIPSIRIRKNNLAILHEVAPEAIRECVPRMLALPSQEIAKISLIARLKFERDNNAFTERFQPFLTTIDHKVTSSIPPSQKRLKIVLLGNLEAPYSTENDLAWTLRDMGHYVLPAQENSISTENILKLSDGADLLIYVHTHGWVF